MGIAKNIPMTPKIEPNKKTANNIVKGWSPNFSPTIIGDKK